MQVDTHDSSTKGGGYPCFIQQGWVVGVPLFHPMRMICSYEMDSIVFAIKFNIKTLTTKVKIPSTLWSE